MGINGPYGSKGFMGAPYKAYGVDEKALLAVLLHAIPNHGH